MDMNDFQKKALRSVAITQKGVPALAHRTLGLTGEAGTLANQLKKVIRDKDGIPDAADTAEAKKRLGDALYYVAVLAEYFDLELSDIAEQNVKQSEAFMQNRANNS
jgi:NTP pyrophosphatase (non-canonical NTP hydrolase)